MVSMVRLAVAAIGAVGAGAAAARLRSRSRDPARSIAAPRLSPGPPAPGSDDPHAAIDAARSRLRSQAASLREEIEGDGGPR